MREDTQPDLSEMVPQIIERLSEGVLTLILNRPEKLNALDHDMVQALHAVLSRRWGDPEVRVIVFHGSGTRAFVGGADISELRDRGHDDALRMINTHLFDRVANIPVPTIAAVRGFALGGGCELAVACDLRVAGESARFGQPETGLGIMAAAGATYRLPQLIGLGRTRELLYTGRIIDAQEAMEIGLVNTVVGDEHVLFAAEEMGRTIARNDALALRMTKLALAQVTAGGPALQSFESTAQAVLFDSDEKRRRMDEFLSRRGGSRRG